MACLSQPGPECIGILNVEIAARINDMTPGDARKEARLQHACILAEGGAFDRSEVVAAALVAEGDTERADFALLEIVRGASIAQTERVPRLLAQMTSERMRAIAREDFVVSLARLGQLERASAELAAISEMAMSLPYAGIQALSTGLADAERLEEALDLIATRASHDPFHHDSLLLDLTKQRLASDAIAEAEAILERFRDPWWQAFASVDIAAALLAAGQRTRGEQMFSAARAVMAGQEDPGQRVFMFGPFAAAAISAERVDLAVDAAPDVGSFPIDHANALRMIVEVGAGTLTEVAWRPLAERAVSLISESADDTAEGRSRQDRALADLAMAVAMAGGGELSMNLAGRISDPVLRDDQVDNVLTSQIDAERLDEALRLLPAQQDWNKQARGFILVARAAFARGQEDLATQAYNEVLALAEGPEWVPLDEITLAQLVELEGEMGRHAVAATRLHFLEDDDTRARAAIVHARLAANSASDDVYADALEMALRSVHLESDTARRERRLSMLGVNLIDSIRRSDALALASRFETDEARDDYLANAVTALNVRGDRETAIEASWLITDATLREAKEQAVLRAALLAALTSAAQTGPAGVPAEAE
jgi:tetratricopeptide (TPR) repeat protein